MLLAIPYPTSAKNDISGLEFARQLDVKWVITGTYRSCDPQFCFSPFGG